MKFKFERAYRGFLGLLFLIAFWAVWASAQTNTNATAVATTHATLIVQTNQAIALVAKLEHLEGRYLTFGLDRVPVLKDRTAFGEPWWKYLASLIYIFLAFYTAKTIDWLTGVWLKKWAEKTETKFDDLLLEALRGPVKVVAFVIFLHVGLNVFHWPEAAQQFLSKGLIVTVAFSLTYVVLKLVDLLMGLWRERTSAGADRAFDEQLYPILRKSAKMFVVVVAVLVTSQNLGINITAAIASLSIGGLALGLAAQDTLANLFGAVAVFMDKPFRIGDRIRVDTVDGTVESIGLRSTRVRNLEGHHVVIPNKTMGNTIITNVTRRPHIRTEMNFGLTYDTPPEKLQRATAILTEIFRGHERTDDLIVSFNKFTDSTLNILVVHVWRGADAKEHFAWLHELNLQVKQRFDAEQIEFAFPTQTVHLQTGAPK